MEVACTLRVQAYLHDTYVCTCTCMCHGAPLDYVYYGCEYFDGYPVKRGVLEKLGADIARVHTCSTSINPLPSARESCGSSIL